jgi:hypothetical protein
MRSSLSDDLTSSAFLDIALALRAFQQIMLTRMKSAIAETLASQDPTIAPDAPAGFLALGGAWASYVFGVWSQVAALPWSCAFNCQRPTFAHNAAGSEGRFGSKAIMVAIRHLASACQAVGCELQPKIHRHASHSRLE